MNKYSLLILISLFFSPILSSYNHLQQTVMVVGGAVTIGTILLASIGTLLRPSEASLYFKVLGFGALFGIASFSGSLYCITKQQTYIDTNTAEQQAQTNMSSE